jgi:hypothetical protein
MAAAFPASSFVVGRAAACRRLASLRKSTYAYPSGYSTKQRQAIMSAVLDADSLMWQQDVSHGNIHPRNIIVVAAEEGEPAAIRVIDFDMARCGIRAKRGYIPSTQLEPRSAVVERWLDKDLVDRMLHFDWLIDWPWNEWLVNEYAKA